MKEPRTHAEWQEAVDAAQGCLALESARGYGLVEGGPVVSVARAEAIVAGGGRAGFTRRTMRSNASSRRC